MDTRPTPDKLRQTLFNILGERVEGGVFLDAYAGTGAVGIEALSRGARHAIFIEKHAGAVQIIRANLASLGLESRSTVLKGNSAVREAELRLADIVFIDPPYTQEREYSAMFDLLAVVAPPLTVVQHPIRLRLPETAGRLSSTRLVKQGDNALSFYVRSD